MIKFLFSVKAIFLVCVKELQDLKILKAKLSIFIFVIFISIKVKLLG